MLRKSACIEDYILKKLASGELGVGDRLPSQNMLAKHFACTRPTVVHALDRLRASGYVTGRRGSGMYVRSKTPGSAIHEILLVGENVSNLQNDEMFLGMLSSAGEGVPMHCKSIQSVIEQAESVFHPGQAVIWVSPKPRVLLLMEHLARQGLPQLLINRDFGDFDYVLTSPEESIAEGVSWLLIEGGRDLAFVTKSPRISMPFIQERILAFYEVCFRLKANLLPDFIFKSDFDDFLADVETVGRTLFDRPKIPGSIFIMTHALTTPLLICANRYNKKLGRDFRMLVFDEVPELKGEKGIAFLSQPIHLFRHEIGNWIRHVASGQRTPFRKKLKCDLITD
jgi:hypothetical protein